MMTVNVEVVVYEDQIAEDYKNGVIDTSCEYPFDEYVEESIYDNFYNFAEVEIPQTELNAVIKKCKKELDKILAK